jgi:hypothetical protein
MLGIELCRDRTVRRQDAGRRPPHVGIAKMDETATGQFMVIVVEGALILVKLLAHFPAGP